MNPSQYFIAHYNKYVLIKKVGNQNISIISDQRSAPIKKIYQKICRLEYSSEQELFEDIFNFYSEKSILQLF